MQEQTKAFNQAHIHSYGTALPATALSNLKVTAGALCKMLVEYWPTAHKVT